MNQPAILNLPKFVDLRGNLSFVEELKHVPFKIERCYWIYDVPGGQKRGGHAFLQQKEFIIALSGSFDVIVNDGKNDFLFSLNRSYFGLYIPNLMWRQMRNFSTNSLAVILSSTKYDSGDYVYDFNYFLKLIDNE